jgi:hypothetical protein
MPRALLKYVSERSDLTHPSQLTFVAVVALAVAVIILVPYFTMATQREQTIFGIESEIERPVPVPKQVLDILRKDTVVSKCVKQEGLIDASPSMFVASYVHLHSGRQVDLVVMSKDGCLDGANIGPIWVFRNSPGG